MAGTMQDWPLLVGRLIDHAARWHGAREIVSLTTEGGTHRTSWREVQHRARQLAGALDGLGIKPGDRVATLAWNTHRHLECWYGISGMGAVVHTINPRLFEAQIAWIANHAEDRLLLFDLSFLPLVERLAPQMPSIRHYVLMTDRAHMPAGSPLDLLCYEELLSGQPDDRPWLDLPETAPAGLCYTSGTTGNPKGVQYSHRANVLHAMALAGVDVMALGASEVVLPVVPMFHANAWGVPYATAAVGATLVMAGPHFDPATLQRLIIDEGVTLALAVPTVWLGLHQHLEARGGGLGQLRRIGSGGSALPRSLMAAYEQQHGVEMLHLWGMTEISPLGSVASPTPDMNSMSYEEKLDYRMKQGRVMFGVDMKIVDETGQPLPHDGHSFGRLLVRGPWVVESYFRGDGGQIVDAEGWFDTGDIATIDALGFMQIVDRAKDVIKSGGEWISSIDLENAAVGAPGVAEAAVVGVPHPKWAERPLLLVVAKPGAEVSKASVLTYLQDKVAKWWLPDDVLVVDELPHTATGKLLKTALRAQYRDYKLPLS
jgi:fatty-acyl-CoA synthase